MKGLRSRSVRLSNRVKRCLSVPDSREQRPKTRKRDPRNRVAPADISDVEPQQGFQKAKSTIPFIGRDSGTMPLSTDLQLELNRNEESAASFNCEAEKNADEGTDVFQVEGQCLIDEGWYDVRIIKVKKGKCLVFYENAEGEETAWLPLEKIRRRSIPADEMDDRLSIGANVLAFQKRASHEIYFDAQIIEVDETVQGKKLFRIRYDGGEEAGETEWLRASDLFLSFPSEIMTAANASEIITADPDSAEGKSEGISEDSSYLYCWLKTQAVPDPVRDAIRSSMKRNAGVVDRILFWRKVSETPEYRVKWHGCSYRLCQFVPRKVLEHIAPSKLLHFERKYGIESFENSIQEKNSFPVLLDDSESDVEYDEGIRADWIMVDRVISMDATDRQAYVKWKGLGYKEATWEDVGGLTAEDRLEIDRFRSRVQAYRSRVHKHERRVRRGANRNVEKIRPVLMDAVLHFDEQPDYLVGGKLHDYQLEGLNWMLHKRSEGTHIILADEMGLGKTVQIAALLGTLMREESLERPFLIVVPLSTLRNWKREFECWCPYVNFVEYSGSCDDRKIIRRAEFDPDDSGVHMFDVLCTSYEIAVQDRCHLSKIHWEGMIVDEAHRLKGGTQSILFDTLYTFKVKQKILVTGTPLQNNLEELFNLIKFLNISTQSTDDSVRFLDYERFCQSHLDSTSDEKIESLQSLLRPYILRRLKKDQNINLSPKVERLIPIQLCALQKEYYSAILTRNYKVLNGESKTNRKFSLLNILMELRKCCVHPFLFDISDQNDNHSDLLSLVQSSSKLQFLDLILPRLKADGHRVLIFSQFTGMLDILETYLEGKEHSYLRIDGTVHGEDRQKRIDVFNDPQSSVFVFLLSTRAGGLGINLATADTVVIFDSDFNPHRDIQALSRAHRIGQQKTVLVLRLVCKGTVEEGILKAANAKLGLESVLVNSLTNSRNRSLSKEDLEQIIALGAEEIVSAVTNTSCSGTNGCEHDSKFPGVSAAASDIAIHMDCGVEPGDSHLNEGSKGGCEVEAVSSENIPAMASTVQIVGHRENLFNTEDILGFLARTAQDSSSIEFDDCLGPFKVPSIMKGQKPKAPSAGCTGTGRFWERLLGQRISQLDMDEHSKMGRGMRERRQVLNTQTSFHTRPSTPLALVMGEQSYAEEISENQESAEESRDTRKSTRMLVPCKRRATRKRLERRRCPSSSESEEQVQDTVQAKSNRSFKTEVGSGRSLYPSDHRVQCASSLCESGSSPPSSTDEESRSAHSQIYARRRKRQPPAFLDAEVLITPSFYRKQGTSNKCQANSCTHEESRYTHARLNGKRRKRHPPAFLDAEVLTAPSFRRKQGTTSKCPAHLQRRRLRQVSDSDSSDNENPKDADPLHLPPCPALREIGKECIRYRRRLRPVSDSESPSCCDPEDIEFLHPQTDTELLDKRKADSLTSMASTAWRPCAQRPDTPSSGSDWDLCWPERQALGLCSAASTPGDEGAQEKLQDQHINEAQEELPLAADTPFVLESGQRLDDTCSRNQQNVDCTSQTPSHSRARAKGSVMPELLPCRAVTFLSFS